MSVPILLAILGMCAQGASDFFYKRAQNRGIVLETYLQVEWIPFALVALLFGYLNGDLEPNRASLIYGPIFGVFSFIAIFLFVSSLREGEASINTLIFRLNFVLVAFFAILFLGERWTISLTAGLVFAGLAIASTAVMGRSRSPAGGGGGRRGLSSRSLALVLSGMFFFSVVNVIFKVSVVNGGNVPFLIVFGACSWSVAAFILMVARGRYGFPPGNWIYFPITGSLKSVSFFCLLTSFRLGGNASAVVPIVQMSFVLTAILAAVFLGETFNRWKWAGLGFAALAILALSS
ncbi:MAG: DMT family transporter [bacterium]|nr:DMT family transporter [bacterium]